MNPEIINPAFALYKNQNSEQDVIRALSYECRKRGYNVRRYRKLKFGAIDLIAWNDKQLVIFEVKYNKDPCEGCFHEILEGLAQLLSYREQFHASEKYQGQIKYVLYSTGELDLDKEFRFLKELCAKYGVILNMRLVNGTPEMWREIQKDSQKPELAGAS